MSNRDQPISFKMKCTTYFTRDIGEISLYVHSQVPGIQTSSFDITGTLRRAEWEWAKDEGKNIRIHFLRRAEAEYGYIWNEEWVEFYLDNQNSVNSEVTENLYLDYNIRDLRTKNKYFLGPNTQNVDKKRNIESAYYDKSVFTTIILNHPYTVVEET